MEALLIGRILLFAAAATNQNIDTTATSTTAAVAILGKCSVHRIERILTDVLQRTELNENVNFAFTEMQEAQLPQRNHYLAV